MLTILGDAIVGGNLMVDKGFVVGTLVAWGPRGGLDEAREGPPDGLLPH